MAKYENIPVTRWNGPQEQVIGRATVEVHEDDGTSTVTIHTAESEFNDFLKKGQLKALGLNAFVLINQEGMTA